MVRKVPESTVRDDTPQLILQTHDFPECMKGVLINMIKIFWRSYSSNPYINEP
jgi:hypothetical protein